LQLVRPAERVGAQAIASARDYGAALDAEALASAAVAAEQAGFESGWVTDHLIVPAEHAGTYGTIAEALVSLGFLAGRTRRLKLGVSALVVPQRQPLVALKQLTTLDFLSGGRIVTEGRTGWSSIASVSAARIRALPAAPHRGKQQRASGGKRGTAPRSECGHIKRS
jgi:alkanesulfonate monooxygenase SsuD/methylene tetrahydromethanopterin reductase-like flavin-dependent oxidoreductase (luciferase family)